MKCNIAGHLVAEVIHDCFRPDIDIYVFRADTPGPEAEEIYFRQRIDLSGLVETQNPKKLNFFKLKLESAKTYSMIDLATMQESASKKTFFTWQDLNGQYGYKFSFEIVKDKEQYLFITIEPFAKEGKDIAYAYAAFYLNQKVITFEAMAYEDSPYKGFIKKILEIK